MNRKKIRFSTTHIILLSFLAAILVGAILLCLPISSADRRVTPFVDALFTSTTATCVTGLVVVPTVSYWSVFGQIIILCLIQIGGLGVITVMAGFAFVIKKKFGISDSLLIQDAFNLNTLSKLGSFVKKVIAGSFIVEGIGALFYMLVFVPEFGIKGVWISLFTSISAFCNAGIDIIAENSLCDYATNPIVNFVTCVLIVLGGLGFIVWWDIISAIKHKRYKRRNIFNCISLHSKIAVTATLLFIFVGAVAFLAFEYNNPMTINNMGLLDKILVAFFQSVTTRTAGFATLPQKNLSNPSAIVSLFLMFIGGSPVGTAGGVKTVTVFVLVATAISAVKNRSEVNLFKRILPKQAVYKAIGVVCMSFAIAFVATLLLSAVTDRALIDIIYETVSATATVGLSRNLTATLNTAGKFIIIAAMYLGRVGPISLAIAFGLKNQSEDIIKNPVENISVG